MSFRDLRDFIATLDDSGELRHVDGADCEHDIGVLSELMWERDGEALLFDNVKGYPKGYRVLSNPFVNYRRAMLSLGFSPDQPKTEAAEKYINLVREYHAVKPKEVSEGPVMENVVRGDDVDLLKFPAVKWSEHDGGRYIGTGSSILVRDPDTGYVNSGTYRIEVHDRKTTGIYIGEAQDGSIIRRKYWEAGKSCPVLVSLGQEPALTLASFGIFYAALGQSELDIAGYLKNSPVEVIVDELTGLPIPARAELVLSGEMPPQSLETHDEGPFGEFTGYYASGMTKMPIIKIKAIYHRYDPINLGIPMLKPRDNVSIFGFHYQAALLLDRLRKSVPGVLDVSSLSRPGMWVIKIRQKYSGHAREAARLASLYDRGGINKYIAVVDEDVDIRNPLEVIWAVSTRSDPVDDVEILKNCHATELEPCLPAERKKRGDYSCSRIIIDACRPFEWIDQFPRVVRYSDEVRAAAQKKWSQLLTADNAARTRELLREQTLPPM